MRNVPQLLDGPKTPPVSIDGHFSHTHLGRFNTRARREGLLGSAVWRGGWLGSRWTQGRLAGGQSRTWPQRGRPICVIHRPATRQLGLDLQVTRQRGEGGEHVRQMESVPAPPPLRRRAAARHNPQLFHLHHAFQLIYDGKWTPNNG